MVTTRPEFLVTEVLRLQVQEGWPDLPNDVLNPNGEGGAWGWATGGEFASLSSVSVAGVDRLRFRPTEDLSLSGSQIVAVWSVPIEKVTAVGQQVRAIVDVTSLTASPTAGQWSVLFNVPNVEFIGEEVFPDPLVVGLNELPATDIPLDTEAIHLVYTSPLGAGADHEIRFRDAWMIHGDAADVAASDPLTDPDWVDVLASTASVSVQRDELNVGVLDAVLYDSTLDPASTDLIRPGKRCRLDVQIGGVWEHLFTGKLENPSSAYEVRDPRRSDLRRVQIKLTGSDAAADLVNDPRPDGVGTIDELPAVMIGTGVPFNVNGSTDAIDPASVVDVAVNDQASALDQIAVTRDSVLGFAWVDRNGVLQAWDRGELAAGVVSELDEEHYSDLDIDFDVDRTFNTLTVILLQINPGTGETEEVKFGPYVDELARRQWRTRKAEFKVQGVDEDLIDEYAAEILALNATPVKRINSVTIPLRTVDEIGAHALRDLYELVSLSNDRAEIAGQLSRVTSVKHRIEVRKEGSRLVNRWWLDLGFSTDGNVASPQVTPSPTAGGGKTLGQRLRPVGEVTQWFGAKADIPAGWLPMDGSAFDGDQYPALAALLGAEVLPNMEDRFPIGAGVKALGTSGGAVTTDEPSDAAVGWAVANAGGSSSPKLSEYNAHTHDVIPPWRALWFIIRAA